MSVKPDQSKVNVSNPKADPVKVLARTVKWAARGEDRLKVPAAMAAMTPTAAGSRPRRPPKRPVNLFVGRLASKGETVRHRPLRSL